MIAALEQHRDQPRVDCHTAIAQSVEYVLDNVREADNSSWASTMNVCNAWSRLMLTWTFLVYQ
jgi:hypothetical protein